MKLKLLILGMALSIGTLIADPQTHGLIIGLQNIRI